VSCCPLTPRKLSSIRTFSIELAKASVPTVEAIIGTALREASALALDTALLSTMAASAVCGAHRQQPQSKQPVAFQVGHGADQRHLQQFISLFACHAPPPFECCKDNTQTGQIVAAAQSNSRTNGRQ
jgi:hypothetical protein